MGQCRVIGFCFGMVCMIFAGNFAAGDPPTNSVEATFSWNDIQCPNTDCAEAGTVPLPAYSSSQQDPTHSLRTKFQDPLPPGSQLIGLNVTLIGRFNCLNASSAVMQSYFILSLNEYEILGSALPLYPYNCGQCTNCMAPSKMVSSFNSPFWWNPKCYNYGDTNELRIWVMTMNQIFLAQADVVFITRGHPDTEG